MRGRPRKNPKVERVKPTLRPDFFQTKKGIHIKLDKDVHTALRSLTFQRGITMQDVFEEFATLLTSDNKRAVGIIDSFILRRLNLPKRKSAYKKKKEVEMSDPEKQSLYDLIIDENLGLDEDPEDPGE